MVTIELDELETERAGIDTQSQCIAIPDNGSATCVIAAMVDVIDQKTAGTESVQDDEGVRFTEKLDMLTGNIQFLSAVYQLQIIGGRLVVRTMTFDAV